MPKTEKERTLPVCDEIFTELDRVYTPEELGDEVAELAAFHKQQPAEASELPMIEGNDRDLRT